MNWIKRLFNRAAGSPQSAPAFHGESPGKSLECAACKRVFEFGKTGQIMTAAVALGMMKGVGGAGHNDAPLDAVYPTAPNEWSDSMRRTTEESLREIRGGLASGQHRRWKCRACGHEQAYATAPVQASEATRLYPQIPMNSKPTNRDLLESFVEAIISTEECIAEFDSEVAESPTGRIENHALCLSMRNGFEENMPQKLGIVAQLLNLPVPTKENGGHNSILAFCRRYKAEKMK